MIRSDVVGSLLRPDYLARARAQREAGEIGAATFKQAEDRAVDEAIRRADGTLIILAAVRAILPPLDPTTGRLHRPEVVSADLQAAAVLVRELGGRAAAVATMLEHRAALGEEVVAFVAWAWQHRRALDLTDAAAAWPPAPELALRQGIYERNIVRSVDRKWRVPFGSSLSASERNNRTRDRFPDAIAWDGRTFPDLVDPIY